MRLDVIESRIPSYIHTGDGCKISSHPWKNRISWGRSVNSSFPGLELILSGVSRRSELKIIFPFILTLQAQIIPGQMDIFSGLFQRVFGQFANFPRVL